MVNKYSVNFNINFTLGENNENLKYNHFRKFNRFST